MIKTDEVSEQLSCPREGTKIDENGAGLARIAYGGRIPPTGLAIRSSKRWCREPDEQLDPDTCRYQGLWPPPDREESTHCRLVLWGYPASPLPREGCHGRDVHAL